MGKGTNIEWTDDTDNVIVVEGGGWWCRKISEGCANCYAAELNQNSFYGGNKLAYTGAPPPLKLRTDLLDGWARQTRPRLHFVASMTDIFGEWVSTEWQFAILDAMAAAPRQIFQPLTKRPEIMVQVIGMWLRERRREQLPQNIWPGCTVENQRWASDRVVPMRALARFTPFTWVSYEPALGPVDWAGWDFLAQIISGGESGKNARPSHPDWHRAARDFCATHGIAYFFKQWGEYEHANVIVGDEVAAHGTHFRKVGKVAAGRLLDGMAHSDFPLFLHPAVSSRPMLHTTHKS